MTDGSPDTSVATNWPKYLTVVFGVWAAVLPLSAWLVIAEVQEIKMSVGRGILPRAEERIDNLEDKLQEHLKQSEDGYRRIRQLEREVAVLQGQR